LVKKRADSTGEVIADPAFLATFTLVRPDA
jgi:hypothetical protein